MRDESDNEIWQRVLAGDSSAFGLVWDRHRDRLFRHLIALGNAGTDAEDLTAVVFLELWRKRASVRFVDDSLLPWLIVTALNVSRNAARGRRRYRELIAKIPLPMDAPDPADVVAERNSPRVLFAREILASARRQDRTLAVLTAVEGFTIAEAAAAVGISESAAKMRMSRLRARLSPAMRPELLTEKLLTEGGPE